MPGHISWHTEETKRKLSEMRRGDRNPFFGRKHTPETKAKMALWNRTHNVRRQYDLEPPRLKRLSVTERAYLAGIVDGEGTVGFRHPTRERNPRPFLAVWNTNLTLMRWLESLGGPGIYARKSPIARKTCYGWSLSGARDLYIVLTAIRPYLRIKRDNADAVLAHLHARYGKRVHHGS
jgi:hypothetical protein